MSPRKHFVTAHGTTLDVALNDPSGAVLIAPNFAIAARFRADDAPCIAGTIGGSNPGTLLDEARRLVEVYGWYSADVFPVEVAA